MTYKNILLALHSQPGVEQVSISSYQWILVLNGLHEDVTVARIVNLREKLSSISPCFKTKYDAVNALETVGEKNIKKLFLSLAGVKDA